MNPVLKKSMTHIYVKGTLKFPNVNIKVIIYIKNILFVDVSGNIYIKMLQINRIQSFFNYKLKTR